MSIVRSLLSFRQPVVYNLDYLSIVIEDKILLMLTWKFKEKYVLSIPSLKRKYRRQESAVIIKVPSKAEVICVIISSFWRRRKFKVVLNRLKLDEETSRIIIRQFKPFQMPNMVLFPIIIKKQFAGIKTPILSLKKLEPHLRERELRIQREKFNYP